MDHLSLKKGMKNTKGKGECPIINTENERGIRNFLPMWTAENYTNLI